MLGSLRTSYDAVIIGGGPAGSTVGYILAKAGLSVLLLEKDKFPRFHIGESLLPATNHVWERIGVRKKLDEVFVHWRIVWWHGCTRICSTLPSVY